MVAYFRLSQLIKRFCMKPDAPTSSKGEECTTSSDVPEFKGGVNATEAAVHEVPEFKGGGMRLKHVHEVPES